MTDRQHEILGVYDMWDDDDISTERLLAMTCDSADCEMEELTQALAEREEERKKEADQ